MFSKRNSRLPLPAAMDFESRRRILYPGSCWQVLIAVCLLWAGNLSAQEIAISYPGLAGDSTSLWMAREGGFFKENGLDAKLVYMEGGRLSIQSLLSGSTQFMAGDAVS